jgi:hypothetical protein
MLSLKKQQKLMKKASEFMAKNPMRYWYDWEFDENGQTIKPISLGMVAEDGRELYLVNESYFKQMEKGLVKPNPWVIENVIKKISPEARNFYGRALNNFGEIVLKFISDNGKYRERYEVELWGHFAAYDHVALAQLFGPMINLPKPIPMFTNDDMTIRGLQEPPFRPADMPEHDALMDAKFQKLQWEKWTEG